MLLETGNIFKKLIAEKADIKWFNFLINIQMERENPETYFDAVYDAYSNEIDINALKDLLDMSMNSKEFSHQIKELYSFVSCVENNDPVNLMEMKYEKLYRYQGAALKHYEAITRDLKRPEPTFIRY